MKNIIEASDLPDDEKIYLKKDWTGWRVVEPIKDPETGEIVIKNVLSRKGFVTLFLLLLFMGILFLTFNEQMTNYKKVMENPCDYCIDCKEYGKNYIDLNDSNGMNINFSFGRGE